MRRNPDDIVSLGLIIVVFLSAGASSGVNTLLNAICHGPNAGILVPIPQYPLYTATLSLLDAKCVPYYLEEEQAWETDVVVYGVGSSFLPLYIYIQGIR